MWNGKITPLLFVIHMGVAQHEKIHHLNVCQYFYFSLQRCHKLFTDKF